MRYLKQGMTIAAALMLATLVTSADAWAHRRYGGGVYYGYGVYPGYAYRVYPSYGYGTYPYYPSYYADYYTAYPYYGGGYYYRRALRHRYYWR